MSLIDILGLWLATGLTLFLFSFLYGDNPFYKLGENLYVGVTLGYMLVKSIFETFIPKVWESDNKWLVVVPVALGLLLLTRFIPKIAWLSRWSFAFIIGYGAGLAIPATINTSILKQAEATSRPLVTIPTVAEKEALTAAEKGLTTVSAEKGAESGEAKQAAKDVETARRRATYSFSRGFSDFTTIVLLVGVFSTLFYFFFSIEHKGPVKFFSRMGIYFLMIYFGASYGSTVMGRLALLYDRLLDLNKAKGPSAWFATPIILIMMIAVLAWRHRTGRGKEETQH